ncbi:MULTISPECIES: hypothetical protein [unclassified Cryobacterium]|uniref:hypothetical protein n=1 Tax=unclassified Cryobacterium TaxID=2649013 RepID=UPI001F547E0D|nr:MULTISPECIES: hypothetical protein [unclassified Cryobacterium]
MRDKVPIGTDAFEIERLLTALATLQHGTNAGLSRVNGNAVGCASHSRLPVASNMSS